MVLRFLQPRVLLALALLPAARAQQAQPPAPSRAEALEGLANYAATYHRRFRQFVATEERVQKRYRGNKGPEQRTTVSDYYVITLPSAPDRMVELRDTLSVDGKPVPAKRRVSLDMLNRKGSSLEAEADRFMRESKRYDLDAFRRIEEYTNMGLLYVDRRVQGHIAYSLPETLGPGAFALRFMEYGANTVARKDDEPAPATGIVYFTYPGLKVFKVDLTLHDLVPEGPALVRCFVDYEPGPDDLMLPNRCRHFLPGRSLTPEPGTLESDAHYTNYRRFTADVKLTVDAP